MRTTKWPSVWLIKIVDALNSPNQSFNISDHVFFSHNNTRSGTFNKLVQPPIKHNRDKQFYFKRLPHLWNALPPIDLKLSFITIRKQLIDIFWKSFFSKFNPDISCTYYFACPSTQSVSPFQNPFSTNWHKSCIDHQYYSSLERFILYYYFVILSGCCNPAAGLQYGSYKAVITQQDK